MAAIYLMYANIVKGDFVIVSSTSKILLLGDEAWKFSKIVSFLLILVPNLTFWDLVTIVGSIVVVMLVFLDVTVDVFKVVIVDGINEIDEVVLSPLP